MTEALRDGTLLARTARGAGWMMAWRIATRLIGFVSTLVLARVLMPADFGLVAIGTTFAQAVGVTTNLGVHEAVIRERTPSRALYDTAFTLGLLRAAVIAMVIAGLAVPAADFFGDARLVHILFALAGATLLEGATNIGVVEFRRDLRFHKEFQFWIMPRLLGTALTISAAFALRNYWALVMGIVLQRVLRVAFSYWVHPYRPRLALGAWRSLVGYSVWSWAVSIAALIGERSDTVLIGRLLGPADVGAFALGSELAHLPTTEVVEPLGRATFSGFASAMHAGLPVGETYLRILAFVALLALPAGMGISLLGEPLVALLFGPAWAEAAPVVQIIGIAGALTLFGRISGTLFQAQGRLASLFGLTAGSAMLRVVLLLVLIPPLGLTGAALAAGTAVALEQIFALAVTIRCFDLSLRALVGATWRCLLATATMALALWALGLGWTAVTGDAAAVARHIIVTAVLGVTVYAAVLLLAWVGSGRPEGAERDMMRALRRTWQRHVLSLLMHASQWARAHFGKRGTARKRHLP